MLATIPRWSRGHNYDTITNLRRGSNTTNTIWHNEDNELLRARADYR